MSRQFTRDYFLELAMGKVSGQTQVNKFGENPSVGVGTTEDVWDGGGTYAFPASAAITHLRQATDQVGTDGNLPVEIQGLDVNWAAVTQTHNLDGTDTTTEVLLGTALRRVFRLKVNGNVVAAADIWVGATGMGAATAKAIIQAGNNQTLMAIYTVPADKTAYITQYYCDNIPDATRHPDSVAFKLWVADRANTYEFQLKHKRGVPHQAPGFNQPFKPYMKITEKSDIKISASVVGGVGEDGNPNAGFDLILVDN